MEFKDFSAGDIYGDLCPVSCSHHPFGIYQVRSVCRQSCAVVNRGQPCCEIFLPYTAALAGAWTVVFLLLGFRYRKWLKRLEQTDRVGCCWIVHSCAFCVLYAVVTAPFLVLRLVRDGGIRIVMCLPCVKYIFKRRRVAQQRLKYRTTEAPLTQSQQARLKLRWQPIGHVSVMDDISPEIACFKIQSAYPNGVERHRKIFVRQFPFLKQDGLCYAAVQRHSEFEFSIAVNYTSIGIGKSSLVGGMKLIFGAEADAKWMKPHLETADDNAIAFCVVPEKKFVLLCRKIGAALRQKKQKAVHEYVFKDGKFVKNKKSKGKDKVPQPSNDQSLSMVLGFTQEEARPKSKYKVTVL